MTEKELLAAFQQAFKDGDKERVEALKEAHEDDVDDVEEVAFHAAVLANNYAYCTSHIGEIDLWPDGGHTPYVSETDDPQILDLLFMHGAIRDTDEYDDCRFLMASIDSFIIAFEPDLAEEVFKKLLQEEGITEAQFCACVRGEVEDQEGDKEYYDEIVKMFGISITDDNKVEFVNNPQPDGYRIIDPIELLEGLGYGCSFEGRSGGLEGDVGMYYIK